MVVLNLYWLLKSYSENALVLLSKLVVPGLRIPFDSATVTAANNSGLLCCFLLKNKSEAANFAAF